jgi:hypothetical protein
MTIKNSKMTRKKSLTVAYFLIFDRLFHDNV